jgi:class 3 adenylate cyclase/tetratricopeptide (TPR) repeat protein
MVRVGSAYCVAAWLILQVAETILPSYDAPNWVMQTLINVLVALFPLVLIAARFTSVSRLIPYESPITPEPVLDLLEGKAVEADEILRLESPDLGLSLALTERRQVTTMACALAGILHGEDEPELVLGYIARMEEDLSRIVERYEGTRLAGGRNQIVVAFGYPNLHEDDVRRAALAAKEILALVAARQPDKVGASIVGRVGLHTDAIIVDEADGPEDELAMLADNNAVAEWLLASAPEDGIIASEASHRLLVSSFAMEEVARLSHPRIGADKPVYRVDRELAGQWQQVMGERLEPIGRDNEHKIIMDHWQTVLDGESQYVLVVADAGMGKSTLVNRTIRELYEHDEPQLIILNCESYYLNSPFRPLISFLEQRLYEGRHNVPNAERLALLREFLDQLPGEHPEALPLIASLLSIELDDKSLQIEDSSKVARQKTLRLMVEILQQLAAQKPLLFVMEDLHWADPSTLALIEELLAEEPEHRIFGLFTARPGFQAPWSDNTQVFAVNLSKLPDRVAERIVRHKLAGRHVSDGLVKRLVTECGGVPFYLDELVRSLRDSGVSLEDDPETLKIPPSLQASLDARVAGLGPGKPLLQLCSVLGQHFSYELLRKVVRVEDENQLRAVLGRLVSEGLLYQKGVVPEATFRFKHRLLMESAYQSLLKKTRAELHGVIGEAIETSFPELCQNSPARMAQHFDRAGDVVRSVSYRLAAARRAQVSFANDEALAQLERGLQQLSAIDDESRRNELEIALQVMKGMVLLSSLGYTNPDVPITFRRALELSDTVQSSSDLFTMIVGLWMYYLIKAEYQQAGQLAGRMLAMARESDDPPQMLQAYYCKGYLEYLAGDMGQAVDYLQEAVSWDREGYDYTRQSPSQDDSRIHAHSMLAASLWLVGDPHQSSQAQQRTFELVANSGQPYAEVWALYQRSLLDHLRRDLAGVRTSAERALDIARTRGFSFFVPLTEFYLAFTIDDEEARLGNLREAHSRLVAAGAGSTQSYMLSCLAEQCIDQGFLEDASALLEQAGAFIDEHGETLFEPEYLRVRARLLLAGDADATEEACGLLLSGVKRAVERTTPTLALRCALALHDIDTPGGVALNELSNVLQQFRSDDESEEFLRAKAIQN